VCFLWKKPPFWQMRTWKKCNIDQQPSWRSWLLYLDQCKNEELKRFDIWKHSNLKMTRSTSVFLVKKATFLANAYLKKFNIDQELSWRSLLLYLDQCKNKELKPLDIWKHNYLKKGTMKECVFCEIKTPFWQMPTWKYLILTKNLVVARYCYI
jgi:hypothetical protein